MGLDNRDYTRDNSNQGGGPGSSFLPESPGVRFILIATVVVYLAQILITRPVTREDFSATFDELGEHFPGDEMPGEDWFDSTSDESEFERLLPEDLERIAQMQGLGRVSAVQGYLELDTDKVLKKGQVWRLLTTAFCHDRMGVWHILFNMLALFWFGRALESQYGTREFLIFYLTAAVVASLVYVGLELATGERHPAIGASGAVMGVFCLFVMWYPRYQINMFMLFPIEVRYLLALYVIYDLHPVLLTLSGTPAMTGVAHSAHLGGLAFGYLYWKNGWRLLPMWNRIEGMFGRKSGPRRPSNVRPSRRKDSDPLEANLDQILAKITEHGQESLTGKERKLLDQASRKYRERS